MLEAGAPIPASLPMSLSARRRPEPPVGRGAARRPRHPLDGRLRGGRGRRHGHPDRPRPPEASTPRCRYAARLRGARRPRPAAAATSSRRCSTGTTSPAAWRSCARHADEQHRRGVVRASPAATRPRRRASTPRCGPAPTAGRTAAVAARLLGFRPRRVRRRRRRRRDRRRRRPPCSRRRCGRSPAATTSTRSWRPPAAAAALAARGQLDDARRFFVDFVRHRGPLPTLRVGRQPYGLLPVMSLDLFAASPPAATASSGPLPVLRAPGGARCPGVPRLRPGADGTRRRRRDPAHAAVVGRATARGSRSAHEVFARRACSIGGLAPTCRRTPSCCATRCRQLGGRARWATPRVLRIIPGQAAPAARRPLVAARGARRRARADYLRSCGRRPSTTSSPSACPPGSRRRPTPTPALPAAAPRCAARLRRRPRAASWSAAARCPTSPTASRRWSTSSATAPRGRATLPRMLDRDPRCAQRIHRSAPPQEPEAACSTSCASASSRSETLPADVLARHLAGCLDLFSYRLDAWITALATRRLQRPAAADRPRARPRRLRLGRGPAPQRRGCRSRPARGRGRRGRCTRPASRGGAMHAPSMAHAATAALLRSGYLADGGEDGAQPFAIDLRSRACASRSGCSTASARGSRSVSCSAAGFERGLHDRRARPLHRRLFRRVSRLGAGLRRAGARCARPDADRGCRAETPGAACPRCGRSGHALERGFAPQSRRCRRRPASRPRGAGGTPASTASRSRRLHDGARPSTALRPARRACRDASALATELDELRQRRSTRSSDALTAEAVYQARARQPGRAAAAASTPSRTATSQPPELAVRGDAAARHAADAPAGRPDQRAGAASPTGRRRAREVRRRAGAGRAGCVRCSATAPASAKRRAPRRRRRRLSRADLAARGRSASRHLDALYLSAAAHARRRPRDLERLIEYHAPARRARRRPGRRAGSGSCYERHAGAASSSGSAWASSSRCSRAFRDTILGARPLDGGDLAPADAAGRPASTPTSCAPAPTPRSRRCAARATGSRAAARSRRDRPARRSAPSTSCATRLVTSSFLGRVRGVPRSPRGAEPARRGAPPGRGRGRGGAGTARLATWMAASTGRRGRRRPGRHDLERLRASSARRSSRCRRCARRTPPSSPRALRRSDEVQGGDPLQALSWLQRAAPRARRRGLRCWTPR